MAAEDLPDARLLVSTLLGLAAVAEDLVHLGPRELKLPRRPVDSELHADEQSLEAAPLLASPRIEILREDYGFRYRILGAVQLRSPDYVKHRSPQ